MCGRYSLSAGSYEKYLDYIEWHGGNLGKLIKPPSRFNIAPGQPVPVIRLKGSDLDQAIIPDKPLPNKEMALMQWGLVPAWAKELPRPMFNARSETVADKPSFRGPFRRRKCLIPADGFYEWQRCGGTPVPYYFSLAERAPFAFAALWEIWMGPGSENWLETVALITKAANPLMKPIHARSPVIVDVADYDLWLRPSDPPDRDIFRKLGVKTETGLRLCEVSDYVNNARHDDEECLTPAKGSQISLF